MIETYKIINEKCDKNVLLNRNEAERRVGTKTEGQISHFLPPVKFRGWVGEICLRPIDFTSSAGSKSLVYFRRGVARQLPGRSEVRYQKRSLEENILTYRVSSGGHS